MTKYFVYTNDSYGTRWLEEFSSREDTEKYLAVNYDTGSEYTVIKGEELSFEFIKAVKLMEK